MPKNIKLKHRYQIVFQGLFVGVKWIIYEDNKKILSGETFNMHEAYREARQAFHAWVRRSPFRLGRSKLPRCFHGDFTNGLSFDV